jgi:hypothetical protein
MRAKLGAPKAITVAAHKLARIVFHMLTTGQAYDETVLPNRRSKITSACNSDSASKLNNLDFNSLKSQHSEKWSLGA